MHWRWVESPCKKGSFIRCSRLWRSNPGVYRASISGSAVSSVVEHFLDTEGVRGSNPLSRTIPLPTKNPENSLILGAILTVFPPAIGIVHPSYYRQNTP